MSASIQSVATGIEEPVYLGDGLYCRFDGWHGVLYAWDGERATNTVYLDPQVMAAQ